ncbi:MAG: HAMP domain-containing histidine kinase [Oscillospiraceae bacterium]|nr:HAMP domain-containing histidine kinase [Oscillospiraceae bacterium]
MKLFVSYIWLHRRSMAVLVLFCAVFAGTFALYRLPLAAVAYPAALCAGLGLCLVGLDYLRFRRRREAVARLAGQGAALAGGLPVPGDAIEEGYQALVRSLQAEVSALAEREGEKYREMTDYYTLWAHQIKTPIAAMRLTLQKEDTEVSRSLSRDLLRIEQYVEMVLAFLRLDSTSTDYVFQACPLDAIIRKAARRFSEEFIARRLKLRYQPIDAVVVTDAKWLGFVLEQVLSNGLKYTRTGGITISMRGGSALCVADTGVGIEAEDLPRIFEKGFTGNRGREDRQASGLGLYLCKRICKNLGAEIWAESRPGAGTAIVVDFKEAV